MVNGELWIVNKPEVLKDGTRINKFIVISNEVSEILYYQSFMRSEKSHTKKLNRINYLDQISRYAATCF